MHYVCSAITKRSCGKTKFKRNYREKNWVDGQSRGVLPPCKMVLVDLCKIAGSNRHPRLVQQIVQKCTTHQDLHDVYFCYGSGVVEFLHFLNQLL